MPNTSIANAKTNVHARLLADSGSWTEDLTGSIYAYEPAPGDIRGPLAVTVSTAGMGPDSYLIRVRVYADPKVGVERVQDDLDALVMEVDDSLGNALDFGPSDWEFEWNPDGMFVATSLLLIGREDYF